MRPGSNTSPKFLDWQPTVWQDKGACNEPENKVLPGYPVPEPGELVPDEENPWLSSDPLLQHFASFICNTQCPVKDMCFKYASLNKEFFGVWGGYMFVGGQPFEVPRPEDLTPTGRRKRDIKKLRYPPKQRQIASV